MHGLIFVTWDQYLAERFGTDFLKRYRKEIGATEATAPHTTRVYEDATLLAGLGAVQRLSGCTADDLLHGYGYYFLLNGLTSHMCTHLLSQVHCARDLLLVMRNAHSQLAMTATSVTPPLFEYQVSRGDPQSLRVLYDSPRHLCALLWGAIEGAAQRYHERVWIYEHTCMKRGAALCNFEIQFQSKAPPAPQKTTVLQVMQPGQGDLPNFIYSMLPDEDGITLGELSQRLRQRQVNPQATRPLFLLQALNHLHYAGWVTSTAYQTEDTLATRRYWRLPPAREE